MKNDPTPAEALANAKEKIESLKRERKARDGNNHPDSRVPGEITPHLQKLGYFVKEFEALEKRWLARIEENKLTVAEARELYKALQYELDIATGLIVPEPNTPVA